MLMGVPPSTPAPTAPDLPTTLFYSFFPIKSTLIPYSHFPSTNTFISLPDNMKPAILGPANHTGAWRFCTPAGSGSKSRLPSGEATIEASMYKWRLTPSSTYTIQVRSPRTNGRLHHQLIQDFRPPSVSSVKSLIDTDKLSLLSWK